MTKQARPLPGYLVQRYHGWKATAYKENQAWYRRLASEGQHPRAMVISCCDSRVHVTSLFGADQGEFFIHRNIANLVPPYEPDGGHHGTSAVLEFAVLAIKVAHVIVMGHSQCGGVKGCIDVCKGNPPVPGAQDNFVGNWMDILRPKYDLVAGIEDPAEQQRAFERQAVVASLENMLTFPFVQEAVEQGVLTLHGLWHDIGEGGLEFYNAETDSFQPV